LINTKNLVCPHGMNTCCDCRFPVERPFKVKIKSPEMSFITRREEEKRTGLKEGREPYKSMAEKAKAAYEIL